MDTLLHEVLALFGGSARSVVYLISFCLTFITAFGRGFLMRKPPLLMQRVADAFLCGVISIPITGLALEERGLSIWWVWCCVMCFGALGFMVFYEFLRDLLPSMKGLFMSKVSK